MSLINLIYASSTQPSTTDSELMAILQKAREKNHRLDITGMLLYRGGNFLQVLEGEQKVVEDLFAVIKADPRHYNVHLIATRPVQERGFGQWEMGFLNLDKDDLSKVPGYTNYLQQPLDSEQFNDGNFAYQFLQTFKEGIR